MRDGPGACWLRSRCAGSATRPPTAVRAGSTRCSIASMRCSNVRAPRSNCSITSSRAGPPSVTHSASANTARACCCSACARPCGRASTGDRKMQPEQQADDLQMEWGLAERVGGDVPPDLSERVLARWRAGESVDEPTMLAAATERHRAWLAAALLLLGLGVVIGASLLQRSAKTAQDAPVVSPDAAEGPDGVEAWQVVSTRAQIEALPDDTRFVEGRNLGDDDVTALVRLPRLE